MTVKNFYFTITPGRSGTVYTAGLLKSNAADSVVYHERVGYQDFGMVSPDMSDMMVFNHVGNVEKVQAFWKRKFSIDMHSNKTNHIEISHFLSKAGLLENIYLLTDQGMKVHIIVLKRDLFKNLWSYINHFDFMNFSFTWPFSLDPRYPNKIIDEKVFRVHGVAGLPLWYLCEMSARAEYYKLLYADNKNLTFHDVALEDIVSPEGAERFMDSLGLSCISKPVQLPERHNETKKAFFSDDIKEQAEMLAKNLKFDAKQIAQNFIDSGRRLASPAVRKV